MATPLVALRLAEDLIEHYDVLAERLGSNRTEVMRAALEQVRSSNPIDEGELTAFRARKAKGKVKVTLGPGNVLKASEGASVAADRRRGTAHDQGERARGIGQRRRRLRAV